MPVKKLPEKWVFIDEPKWFANPVGASYWHCSAEKCDFPSPRLAFACVHGLNPEDAFQNLLQAIAKIEETEHKEKEAAESKERQELEILNRRSEVLRNARGARHMRVKEHYETVKEIEANQLRNKPQVRTLHYQSDENQSLPHNEQDISCAIEPTVKRLDQNENLAAQLRLVARLLQHIQRILEPHSFKKEALRLAELVAELNEWIRNDGVLPDLWAEPKVNPVPAAKK